MTPSFSPVLVLTVVATATLLALALTLSSSSLQALPIFWCHYQGGAGNDSILINAMSAGSVVSSVVYGQKGDDTITVVPKIGSAGSNNLTIQGGMVLTPLQQWYWCCCWYWRLPVQVVFESTLIRWIPSPYRGHLCWWCCFVSSRVRIDITTGAVTLVSGAGASVVLQLVATLSSVVIRTTALRLASLQLMRLTTTGDTVSYNNTTRYLFVRWYDRLVVRLSDEASLSAGKAGIFKSGNNRPWRFNAGSL